MEKELGENSNALRIELNRLEDAGLLGSEWIGQRKLFRVNRSFPMFDELHSIILKHFGIDQVIKMVLTKIGPVDAVYLVGDLAAGLDSDTIDVLIIGDEIHLDGLEQLRIKAETLIKRSIRCTVQTTGSELSIEVPNLRLL